MQRDCWAVKPRSWDGRVGRFKRIYANRQSNQNTRPINIRNNDITIHRDYNAARTVSSLNCVYYSLFNTLVPCQGLGCDCDSIIKTCVWASLERGIHHSTQPSHAEICTASIFCDRLLQHGSEPAVCVDQNIMPQCRSPHHSRPLRSVHSMHVRQRSDCVSSLVILKRDRVWLCAVPFIKLRCRFDPSLAF